MNRIKNLNRYPILLSNIKKELPENCTFLASVRKSNKLFARAFISGIKFEFNFPSDFAVSQSAYEAFKEVLIETCEKVKSGDYAN